VGSFRVSTRVHESSGLHVDMAPIPPSRQSAIVLSKSAATNSSLSALIQSVSSAAALVISPVESEPSVQWLESRFPQVREVELDHIVAIGGGSCIDTAKVLAFAYARPEVASLSVLASSASEATRMTPNITAVPTTAGTGSEVTSFATVWDRKYQRKLSVDHESLTPTHALLIPEALSSLRKRNAVAPLLDAMSHSLESLWNSSSSEFSDVHACSALRKIFEFGPEYLLGVREPQVLRHVQLAATNAGIAIQQTRTSIAHAVSYPLTLNKGIPHGYACAFLLPAIWTYVAHREPVRYARISQFLGHRSIEETRSRVEELLQIGELQSALQQCGFSKTDVSFEEVQSYSRSQNFSQPLTAEVLESWVDECV